MPGLYGDISARVGIFASTRLLADAKENLVLSRWALQQDIPKNRGTTINWRRYSNLATAVSPIVGSNTPDGQELAYTNITATIQQFGSWVPVSQVIRDTHEDPILQQASDKLSFQMAKTIETLTFNTVVGGTNVHYVGAPTVTARTGVNAVINRKDFRQATRTLLNYDASEITSLVRSTPDYATHGIEPAFFAYAHTDLDAAFRAMTGFIPVSEYSSRLTPLKGEVGSVEKVRIILSNIAVPFAGGGASGGTNVIETGGNADVYPILIFAQEAFATTKLSGMNAARLMVHNPQVTESDPLGQRGSVGWISWFASAILNQNFMVRIETAAPDAAGISN